VEILLSRVIPISPQYFQHLISPRLCTRLDLSVSPSYVVVKWGRTFLQEYGSVKCLHRGLPYFQRLKVDRAVLFEKSVECAGAESEQMNLELITIRTEIEA
jgi:hypothetical protein